MPPILLPFLDGDDHAYNLVASYSSELWQLGIGYIEIADNFNPEVGFLRRSGFRNVDVGVAYTFRPTHFWKLQTPGSSSSTATPVGCTTRPPPVRVGA